VGAYGLHRLSGGTWSVIASVPDTAIINCLLRDSDGRLFAGTSGKGIYCSTNDGTTWTGVSIGSGADTVKSLAADSTGKLWAGTNKGVWSSTDHGSHWSDQALPNISITALAAGSGGVVYAGSQGANQPAYQGSLYRSQDGGKTFDLLPNTGGLANLGPVSALCATDQGVFLGANGALFSADQGKTWQGINNGLLARNRIEITFGPTGDIWATSQNGGGLYHSTDHAVTWTRLQPPCNASLLHVHSKTGNLILGGMAPVPSLKCSVWRSTDNGAHWDEHTPASQTG